MGELLELLSELSLEEPIAGAVLITLVLWFICISVMGTVVGGVVPLVVGLLIFALLRRSKQPFTTLELLGRNESTPRDSVVRQFKQSGVGRLKPAPPSSRGGPTGAAG